MSGLFGIEPLVPAYGRDHMTLEEAQADFNKDKDFQTPSGRYTNRSDLAKMYPHLERIRVRFNRLEDTGYVLFKSELKPEPKPRHTTSTPSDEQLGEWMMDGVCEAVDGCRVEPDGTCEHGSPSWLLQLGMI